MDLMTNAAGPWWGRYCSVVTVGLNAKKPAGQDIRKRNQNVDNVAITRGKIIDTYSDWQNFYLFLPNKNFDYFSK